VTAHDDFVWAILFAVIAFGILVTYRPDMPVFLLMAGYVSGFLAVLLFSAWVQKVMW
jgi:hypothetical protein